jgi:hypothetical protein
MLVIASAASAMGIMTTLSVVQMAHAAPNSPHGTCFFNKGVSGCAGNIGGFVDTHNKDCRQINKGPFNTFSCPQQ